MDSRRPRALRQRERSNRVDGIKPIVAALRKGGLLYLLPDMDFGRDQSVFVPFLACRPRRCRPFALRAAGPRQGGADLVARHQDGYEIEVLPDWKDFPSDDAVAERP